MGDPFQSKIWENFWDAPHKSLFLSAYACALFSVAWWPLGVDLGLVPPAFFPVELWHVHELIFGFAGAAVGGYLLTALPSWTGKEPVAGWPIISLTALWFGSRVFTSLAEVVPKYLPIVFNSCYFLMLSAIILLQSIKSEATRGVLFGTGVLAIGAAQFLYLLSVQSGAIWITFTLAHSVVLGFALLMTIIGMRAIPAFTNNWLLHRDQIEGLVKERPLGRVVAPIFLSVALIGRLTGHPITTSIGLLLAAAILAYAMMGWRTLKIVKEPLLVALHVSFLWIPFGLIGLAALTIFPEVYPSSSAIHTLTIGAMSGLIMGISGRAAAHHHSGKMKAGPLFVVGFAFVWFATIVRLVAPLSGENESTLLIGAATFWCVGWFAFIVGYIPALRGPSPRPVLSGKKIETQKS